MEMEKLEGRGESFGKLCLEIIEIQVITETRSPVDDN